MILTDKEIDKVKDTLFQILADETSQTALVAANLLIQLAQIPAVAVQKEMTEIMRDVRDNMKEGLEIEKKEREEKNART